MKKIISLLLAISMLLSVSGTVLAIDAPGLEAKILESTNVVNVTGQFDGNTGDIITILLVDDNKQVKFIQRQHFSLFLIFFRRFFYDELRIEFDVYNISLAICYNIGYQ